MARMLGYMVTWTTYGTWVQGDARGYATDGEVLGENAALEEANQSNMRDSEVRLSKRQKEIVKIYLTRHRSSKHKMGMPPVCLINDPDILLREAK